jgi:hypothetical protein
VSSNRWRSGGDSYEWTFNSEYFAVAFALAAPGLKDVKLKDAYGNNVQRSQQTLKSVVGCPRVMSNTTILVVG